MTMEEQETTERCSSEERRKLRLKAEHLVGSVRPDRVYCKPCAKYIKLSGRMPYTWTNWHAHRERRHPHVPYV